jgi:nitrogen regulatory protein P-II 2
MQTTKLKLVTIIAEAILEDRLLKALGQLGARGYTVDAVHGKGSRGIRGIDMGGQNIRVETIVGPEVAERIMAHVAQHYFADYAVIVYCVEAEVLRSAKYL